MRRMLLSFRFIPFVQRNSSYSSKGFFKSLVDKVKEESTRNTELRENIKKFREETARLEQSKELQSVREFYRKIEKDLPTDSFEKIRDRLNVIIDKLKEEGQQITANDSLRKSLNSLSKATEQMKGVTKSLSETELLKTALKGIEAVEQELQSDRAKMYQPPLLLKTRSEVIGKTEERLIEPDSESSGVVLHKDSKWFEAWQEFKDHNQYMQKFFDLKTQYEESDHLFARSVRFLTDRVGQLFGGLRSDNELQVVLDEISKLDSTFELESFLRYCRFVAIPNVLEAINRADMQILQDWCHEAPFNVLSAPLKNVKELGHKSESRILDINHVDVQMGKMMEQGPVLVITFQAQQIHCIRDTSGAVREGDPNKVMRVVHVWAMCRDQSELHRWAAWRILDIAMMSGEQWL